MYVDVYWPITIVAIIVCIVDLGTIPLFLGVIYLSVENLGQGTQWCL